MARYFLEKSPTYARVTDKKIYRRREAVCRHLNDVYKAGKNKDQAVFKLIVDELAAKGMQITDSQYRVDKVIFRYAFLWLNESDEAKKEELAKKWPQAKGVIGYLKKDNINSWADLKLDEPPASPAVAEESPIDPFTQLKQKFADLQTGEKVLDSLHQLFDSLGPFLDEYERIKRDFQSVEEFHKDQQTYLDFVEEENEVLEKRLQEAKESLRHARSATLEEIATEHPEIPELFAIAQKLKQAPPRWQSEFEYLTAQLPKTFAWQNDSGPVDYDPRFLKPLVRLQKNEQDQVIKQVHALSQDPERHSLDTRKNEGRLPFSPLGCMSSRGSDVWRFSWKKNGGIVIHALYRKSNTRLRQSEA